MMRSGRREFHGIIEEFISIKLSQHSYLVFGLDNYAMNCAVRLALEMYNSVDFDYQ